jgi:RHS repeat-associated protein
LYWVTDGEGRQYQVGTLDGADQSGQINYQNEGKYAGSIANARTFENQRFQSPSQNALSSYRNRFYDRETGRWIQEDPLGITAGFNAYAYVGNNPASFTDPFGLCTPWPECASGAVKEPLFDPVALLAGGIAGGIRVLSSRILGRTAGSAAVEGLEEAGVRFAQKGISSTFRHGEFAGKSLESVAKALRNGSISPDQLPLNVVVRNGVAYTMNNRSLMALRMAGMNPTRINYVTGVEMFERQLTERLAEIAGSVGSRFTPIIR